MDVKIKLYIFLPIMAVLSAFTLTFFRGWTAVTLTIIVLTLWFSLLIGVIKNKKLGE